MPQLDREAQAGLAGDRGTRKSLSSDDNSALLELDRRNSLAHAIVATVREPLIVLDRKMRVVTASRSFLKLFDMESGKSRGRLIPSSPAFSCGGDPFVGARKSSSPRTTAG